MKTITEYQELISNQIDILEDSRSQLALYDPVSYILSIGGKRLRPVLTLIGTDLFDGNLEDSYKSALGIEMFHNFTLLHDDIMDDAPLRRGKETVHEKWNINSAILSGDVMFVQAFVMVTSCKTEYLRSVLDLFNVTAIEVCEGQHLDMEFETREDVTIPEYIEMIKLKTSVLVGCALKLGAILADATEEQANLIYDFGLNLGIAFQIQDDILDVFGDAALFGKQVGGDILANKKTYLLLKALENANETQEEELNSWMNVTDYQAEQKVEAVTAIFNDLKVKEQAESVMWSYYDKALEALNKIGLSEQKYDYLLNFAKGLMVRTK
ncbi:MAG: polyprenyl synthetase family protein [Flavobacteriales bacterium]|jgi:geranylgeranyl diphosphate synthase type II|nr:polyprenyl synthetase family protein [Flavobacteriales bacterium]